MCLFNNPLNSKIICRLHMRSQNGVNVGEPSGQSEENKVIIQPKAIFNVVQGVVQYVFYHKLNGCFAHDRHSSLLDLTLKLWQLLSCFTMFMDKTTRSGVRLMWRWLRLIPRFSFVSLIMKTKHGAAFKALIGNGYKTSALISIT